MSLPIVLFSFIQGLTEFLPISSQGHLIIFNTIFPIKTEIDIRSLNIIAHFGSLAAVIIYYRSEVIKLMFSLPNVFRTDIDNNAGTLINLIISTIPIFIIGYILTFFLQTNFFNSLKLIGWTTLIFGVILFIVDKGCLRIKTMDRLPKKLHFILELVSV